MAAEQESVKLSDGDIEGLRQMAVELRQMADQVEEGRISRPEPSIAPMDAENLWLPRLAISLFPKTDQLREPVQEGASKTAQMKRTAGAGVPPLGPASREALSGTIYWHELLLSHAAH